MKISIRQINTLSDLRQQWANRFVFIDESINPDTLALSVLVRDKHENTLWLWEVRKNGYLSNSGRAIRLPGEAESLLLTAYASTLRGKA